MIYSHRQKRMRQMKQKKKDGKMDINEDDPFELFILSTTIRYCYYAETHKILGNTFGVCILQVGPAFLKPNSRLLFQNYIFYFFPTGLWGSDSQHFGKNNWDCRRWRFSDPLAQIYWLSKATAHHGYGYSCTLQDRVSSWHCCSIQWKVNLILY